MKKNNDRESVAFHCKHKNRIGLLGIDRIQEMLMYDKKWVVRVLDRLLGMTASYKARGLIC